MWKDVDYDYLSLLDLIELKTKRTRQYLLKENLVKVDVKRMLEIEYLCKRIKEDEYFSDDYMNEKDTEFRRRVLLTKIDNTMEAELDRLFLLLRKHIRYWWS